MRSLLQWAVAAGLAVAVPCVRNASADVIRVLATDPRGVTLQLTTEPWSLSAPEPDGRVRVVGVPDAHSLADPGHALLPAYSALLALPPDAHPVVRVLAAGAPVVREGVRLAIATRPHFSRDDRGAWQPGEEPVAPVLDGPWPSQQVVLGAPSAFRGRRLVGVELQPFQYDEASGRLQAVPTLTVRIDFGRPAGAAALPVAGESDPHFDEVLRTAVINFEQAAGWRVAPAGQGGRSLLPRAAAAATIGFDESQPEVRVRIDSTGVWLLPYDQLAAHNYPTNVPIGQVSVHRHEFLEGQDVPYGTVDVPIEVEDANHDGLFNSGDRIWMVLRSWAARSSASRPQRFWGDADVVYATVNPAGGARMAKRDGWRGVNGLTPLASFPHFQHWETNAAPLMPYVPTAHDTTTDLFQWTDAAPYYDRPDSIKLGINDIDTTHAVQFTTNWVGRANTGRFIWASIKNPAGQVTSLGDSIYWSGKYPLSYSISLNGSALRNGIDRFQTWGRNDLGRVFPIATDAAFVGLDWIEATYWRSFNAVHDVLWFNSADAAGEYQLHAGGFYADSVRVYDITQPDDPVRVLIDPAHVTAGIPGGFDLQDSTATGQRRSYVAATVQEPRDPAFGPLVPPDEAFATVTREYLYTNAAADYLLIVPQDFRASVQPLVDLRRSHGLRVLVVPAEDLYDEFNGGRHSAAAIQRFLKYAYNKWSSRFVLLVGDGTLDPQDVRGTAGKDWIPVLPTPAPVFVTDGYEITPSDNRYSCITGNCDPIVNNAGFIPEMMVGRLPVNSVAETQAVVDKIVRYENVTGDPAWRRHLLLLADDAFSGETTFGGGGTGSSAYCEKAAERRFVKLDQKIASVVLGESGLAQTNVELFNLRYYITNEQPVITLFDTCRVDRLTTRTYVHAAVTPVLMSHLNSGTLWWNYQGHANEYVLTHEDLYTNIGDFVGSDDKFDFSNTDQPVLYSAFSCHANMFARPEGGEGFTFGGCLGEDMVTLPARGAIASWASSSYEEVPRDDSTHLNVELARSMFRYTPHDPQVWDRGARLVLGEAIQATFLRYIPSQTFVPFERGVAITYTLLGDPALRMSIGRPQSIVYANDSLVVDHQPVRLHTLTDTLSLVADLVSTARIDTLGLFQDTGSGNLPIDAANYTVTPPYPDTLAGGVYGGRRFRLRYFTHLAPRTQRFLLRTRDRDGLLTDFTVEFQLDATLRADGAPIQDGDDVSPVANLSALFVSPAPIVPASDLTITINGVPVVVDAVPASGDVSGREWLLSWTHPPFPKDNYVVEISVRGGGTITRRFVVTTASGDLKIADLYAFPNPFDNNGTAFSFRLLGSDPADVKITVMTISGRQIHSTVVRGLGPGYHQVPWDGTDAEGDVLANGVYFYRLSAVTDAGRRAEQLGRLVKLRKPRHADLSATP
jgi:hypothetical protein